MKTIAQWLIWVGAGSTLLLVVLGLISSTSSGPYPWWLFPVFVGLVLWMLSPYWGAVRQHKKLSINRSDVIIFFCGTVLVVGFAGYAYLSEFVILPRFYGIRPRATGSGMLVVIAPLFQWVGIGITAALRWVVNRLVLAREPHHSQ